jgi:hypothetical protein
MAHPIPQAKTALKAILTARSAWAAVDIRDGQWTESEDVTRDAFWFDATEIPRDGWASLGAQRRRVEFRLAFTIALLREGDDERVIEDAVWTLVEDLMAALKADYSLGATIQQAGDVSGSQRNTPYSPGVWQSTFTGSIACTSRAY